MVSMPGEILHPYVRQEGLHVVLEDRTGGRRRRGEGGDLRFGQRAGEDEDLVDVSGEITRNPPKDGLRGGPDRGYRIRRILGDEQAIHVEFYQAGLKDGGCMMPFSVVVGERTRSEERRGGKEGR